MATFDGKDALVGLVEGRIPALRREALPPGRRDRRRRGMVWNMTETPYPHATYITDIWRARGHPHGLAAHLAFITPDPAQ